MPTKPSKPGEAKAAPKKTRRPSLKLTDETVKRCEAIAAKNTVFGTTPPVKAIAEAALKRGLEVIEAE